MSTVERLPYVEHLREVLARHDVSPADHYILLRLDNLLSGDGYRRRHAREARMLYEDLSPSLRSDAELQPPPAEPQ